MRAITRRGTHTEEAVMIEFNECRPNPGAPTLFVNRIGGIYRVSKSIMKVTFVLTTAGKETVEAASLLWEDAELYEANSTMRWALEECRRGTFSVEDLRFIRAH
jgi:hypothetical protein